MKVATWNVNSLRVRLPQVLEWLGTARPDILALQETKLADDQFPLEQIEAAGYRAAYAGQKTYNGVATFSLVEPRDILTDVPGLEDPQRRILAATYDDVRVINLYVPNGEHVESEKYGYKLYWLERLTEHIEEAIARHRHVVVLGDFNIAPEARDVHDPEQWEGRVLFSEAERAAFRRLLDLGLCDTFRLHEHGEGHYSWWDYRMGAFRRNRGLRIDHILASGALCEHVTDCHIDKAPRGWERPSDHTPVVAQFEI